jgi:hypothetical protein
MVLALADEAKEQRPHIRPAPNARKRRHMQSLVQMARSRTHRGLSSVQKISLWRRAFVSLRV